MDLITRYSSFEDNSIQIDFSQTSYYSTRFTKSKTAAPLIVKDQIWVKFYDVQYVMCAKPET